MLIKQILKQLQKLFPEALIYKLQELHYKLIYNCILSKKSQSLVVSTKSAIVFSPHQDDETLGCGGTIALKRRQGVPVTVVFLTDGHKGGVSVNQPDEVIQIRKQEAIKALSILGVELSEIHFLEQPDGDLGQLETQQRQALIDHLVEVLKLSQPEEVYVPHRKDCHRDHEAAYQLIQEAIAKSNLEVELLQYPIWLLWRAPLFIILQLRDIANGYKLAIDSVQPEKKQAIAAYQSQITLLPPGFLKSFLGSYEIFFKS